ncbi:MAG: tryptophan-rich sensory protein [Patescibacteria group bacterium]|nr:tryptophan-rich sensory protein [Patescibacteria group bacterium]
MNYKRLIISLLLPQLAGLIGSVFTAPAIPGWYAGLARPPFSPPNWVFAPAWITLYLLMGLAVFFIWQKESESEKEKSAVNLFWLNLFFNAIWSPIFFGLKNPGLAFVNIVIILIFIIILIIKFWPIRKLSAYLLIPYLAWVSFASCLNYYIWILN